VSARRINEMYLHLIVRLFPQYFKKCLLKEVLTESFTTASGAWATARRVPLLS
jgi:hypothetical protein